jgi:hypothetical protein
VVQILFSLPKTTITSHIKYLTFWLNSSIVTTMKHAKKIKMKLRSHYALFNKDLPFKARVERDRTKYTRKQKHRKDLQ